MNPPESLDTEDSLFLIVKNLYDLLELFLFFCTGREILEGVCLSNRSFLSRAVFKLRNRGTIIPANRMHGISLNKIPFIHNVIRKKRQLFFRERGEGRVV